MKRMLTAVLVSVLALSLPAVAEMCDPPYVTSVKQVDNQDDVFVIGGCQSQSLRLLEGATGAEVWSVESGTVVEFLDVLAGPDGSYGIFLSNVVGQSVWPRTFLWAEVRSTLDGSRMWLADEPHPSIPLAKRRFDRLKTVQAIPDSNGDNLDDVVLGWTESRLTEVLDMALLEVRDGLTGDLISWTIIFGRYHLTAVDSLFSEGATGLLLSCAPYCNHLMAFRAQTFRPEWVFRGRNSLTVEAIGVDAGRRALLLKDVRPLPGNREAYFHKIDGRSGRSAWSVSGKFAEGEVAYLLGTRSVLVVGPQHSLTGIDFHTAVRAFRVSWTDGATELDLGLIKEGRSEWHQVADVTGDGVEEFFVGIGEPGAFDVYQFDGVTGEQVLTGAQFDYPTVPVALGADVNEDSIHDWIYFYNGSSFLVDGAALRVVGEFPFSGRITHWVAADLSQLPGEMVLRVTSSEGGQSSIVGMSRLQVLWTVLAN